MFFVFLRNIGRHFDSSSIELRHKSEVGEQGKQYAIRRPLPPYVQTRIDDARLLKFSPDRYLSSSKAQANGRDSLFGRFKSTFML